MGCGASCRPFSICSRWYWEKRQQHCPMHTTIPWCCDLCTVLCTQHYHDVVTYALSYARNTTMMLWPMHCPMHTTIPWCCDGGEACGTRSVELWSGPSRHCLGQSQPWQRALWPWGGRSRVSGCHWTASGCACWATPSESASRITHLSTLDTIPLNFILPFCSMLNKGWHLYQLLVQYPWTSMYLSVWC